MHCINTSLHIYTVEYILPQDDEKEIDVNVDPSMKNANAKIQPTWKLSPALRRETVAEISTGICHSIIQTSMETYMTNVDTSVRTQQKRNSKMAGNNEYFMCQEKQPLTTHYAHNTGDRGGINEYNNVLVGIDKLKIPIDFTEYSPHVYRHLRQHIFNVNDADYYDSFFIYCNDIDK